MSAQTPLSAEEQERIARAIAQPFPTPPVVPDFAQMVREATPAAPAEDCMACADLGYPCHWCTVKRSEAQKIAAPAARAEGEDAEYITTIHGERFTLRQGVNRALHAWQRIDDAAYNRLRHYVIDLHAKADALAAAESAREAAERERDSWMARAHTWDVERQQFHARAERAEAALRGLLAFPSLAYALEQADRGIGTSTPSGQALLAARAALAPAPGGAETGEVGRG